MGYKAKPPITPERQDHPISNPTPAPVGGNQGRSSGGKLHTRDSVSGLWQHQDIPDGEYGANDISKRNAARLEDLNKRISGDWQKDMLTADANATHPTYGDAATRMPKPSDVVTGSKATYGGGQTDSNDSGDASNGKAAKKGRA